MMRLEYTRVGKEWGSAYLRMGFCLFAQVLCLWLLVAAKYVGF